MSNHLEKRACSALAGEMKAANTNKKKEKRKQKEDSHQQSILILKTSSVRMIVPYRCPLSALTEHSCVAYL